MWVIQMFRPITLQDLDSAGFMFIDDDAAGSACCTSASLMSPVFNAVGYDTLTLSLITMCISAGDRMYVEVYDGSSWVSIDTITGQRALGLLLPMRCMMFQRIRMLTSK